MSPGPSEAVLAELAEIRKDLAAIGESMNRVIAQLDTLVGAQPGIVDQLQRVQSSLNEVHGLAPLVHRHETLVNKHETDIVQWLSDQNARRQDVESELHRERIAVWKEFEVVVIGRWVEHVVNSILQSDVHSRDEAAKAKLFSQVVSLLFPPETPDGPEAIDATEDLGQIDQKDLHDLRSKANEVGQDAKKLGMVACWGPVDEHPDWFEDWRSSGSGETAFVVVPAWVADGQMVGPGKVFKDLTAGRES